MNNRFASIGQSRDWLFGLVALAAMVGALPARTFAEAEALPTSADLHKMFDDGQYAPLLAKLARVLPLTGPAAKQYDKFDLNLLKANALVAMKQQPGALRAIADALKLATDKTDADQVAEAQAMEVLLKYCPKGVYVPKGPKGSAPGQPIALDLPTRDDAYKALLTDLQADAAEKVAAANSAKSLPTIRAALAKLVEVAPVEKRVTKSDADIQKSIDEMAGQATGLMSDAAKSSSEKLGMLTENANISIMSGIIGNDGGFHGTPRKRGLVGSEPKDVKAVIGTCEKLQTAAKDFAGISKRHADQFASIAASAEGTARDGVTLLKTFHAIDR